jgi:hypothetical protein
MVSPAQMGGRCSQKTPTGRVVEVSISDLLITLRYQWRQ